MDDALFRRALPEFASTQRYPPSVIAYWLDVASKLVNADRWGSLTDNGLTMFTAHNLTLERQAMDTAANNGDVGVSKGPINQQSVDKVSVGYDTTGGAELDAGHWNLTIYGTRFIRLARMMGTGGLQIGSGNCIAPSPFSSANAWGGPWTYNFPNQNS